MCMDENNLLDLEFVKEMESFLNADLSSLLNGYVPYTSKDDDKETLRVEVDK